MTRPHPNVRFGWWALLAFLTLGIALEMMHGFKVQWYVSLANETRRHLWTLAHAHGTLLALVNVVFGVWQSSRGRTDGASVASRLLRLATVVMPAGFLLGGAAPRGGDPGLGAVLIPVGAALLLVSVLLTARGAD